ncbi:synaptic vesicle glycoprotein 2A-like [Euwallacea similis]|uniref:synaptic vesicle glycoprotein 2A-like n=1 Tax=Euwallacea similis TaxID=1736056 RepID=UPI003450A777
MKEAKETKLYSEAVTLTGYGKYNLFVILATGGCLMCVIVESMNMSFIIPAAQCDLNLSLSSKGLLVSITFLGIITTSYFWGFMADAHGRKNILVFCLITSSLITLGCSMVSATWLLILLRYMNGALIGGASSIIYPFAGEFHDNQYRPKVITWVSSFVAVGQMYIPGMAWAILPHKWSYHVEGLGIDFRPWRLLLIAYAIPSLIVAALLSLLPESPKFLLSQGKHDHTLKILTKMFVYNTGKKSHEYPVSTIIMDEIVVEKVEENRNFFQMMWSQTTTLFGRRYIVKTLLICYLQFGVFLSASALSLWFPQILNTLSKQAESLTNAGVTLCGSENTDNLRLQKSYFIPYKSLFWRTDNNVTLIEDFCDDSVDTHVFLVVLLIGCGIGIAYILIGTFINKIGKKKILIGSTVVTACCGLVAQYVYGYETILTLCGVYLLISSMIGVVNAFAVDLYPTSIRAMALAVSLMFGRMGAMIGSNLVGIVYYNYCDYIFIFFAVNHLVLVVAAILLPTRKVQDLGPVTS